MSLSMLSLFNPKGSNLTSSNIYCAKSIHPSDVATALAYADIPKWVYIFALAKYCNDVKAHHQLLTYYKQRIQNDINCNEWKDEINRAEKLALIVIHESIYASTCRHCDGSGYRSSPRSSSSRVTRLTIDETLCHKCHGTGKRPTSVRTQEKITHISKSSWSRTWRKRLDSYVSEVRVLESDIAILLRRQFSNKKSI